MTLHVKNLSVRYDGPDGPVHVVNDVSLTLDEGAALVLLGQSGSGKSTVVRTVLGLPGRAAHVTGRILLGGTDLRALREAELSRIRGRRIGYVPQDPTGALDPLRRIGPQLVEVLLRHRIADSRRAARAAVPALLTTAGITDPERVARAYPHELSGGLKQRAVIALAVSCGPELLIADEATTALDALVRGRVLDLFDTLRAERGISLLLVTHDLTAARRIGGRVAVLHEGRVVETGPTESVLTRPALHASELLATPPGDRP